MANIELVDRIITPIDITTGVLQGSILGSLLFLLYMNDLQNASEVFEFISFADDTDLFSAIEYSMPITRTKCERNSEQ